MESTNTERAKLVKKLREAGYGPYALVDFRGGTKPHASLSRGKDKRLPLREEECILRDLVKIAKKEMEHDIRELSDSDTVIRFSVCLDTGEVSTSVSRSVSN